MNTRRRQRRLEEDSRKEERPKQSTRKQEDFHNETLRDKSNDNSLSVEEEGDLVDSCCDSSFEESDWVEVTTTTQ